MQPIGVPNTDETGYSWKKEQKNENFNPRKIREKQKQRKIAKDSQTL